MDVPTEERLQTRKKNKDQHPGEAHFIGRAKRRTRAEMEEYRRELEAKKKEVETNKNAVIKRIAQLESDMATQDKAAGHAHPRSRKGQHVSFLVYSETLLILNITDMREEEDTINIPSDGSIPPPKKKRIAKVSVKPPHAQPQKNSGPFTGVQGIFIMIFFD